MSALMTRIQQELDAIAAEQGATHVRLSRSTLPNGKPFYTASFHNGNILRSAHGDTLNQALDKAALAEPFDATPEEEAA